MNKNFSSTTRYQIYVLKNNPHKEKTYQKVMSINLELPPLLEISVDSNRITKEKGTGRLNINLNLNKYKL